MVSLQRRDRNRAQGPMVASFASSYSFCLHRSLASLSSGAMVNQQERKPNEATQLAPLRYLQRRCPKGQRRKIPYLPLWLATSRNHCLPQEVSAMVSLNVRNMRPTEGRKRSSSRKPLINEARSVAV